MISENILLSLEIYHIIYNIFQGFIDINSFKCYVSFLRDPFQRSIDQSLGYILALSELHETPLMYHL